MQATTLVSKRVPETHKLYEITKSVNQGTLRICTTKKDWFETENVPFIIDPRREHVEMLVIIDKATQHTLMSQKEFTFDIVRCEESCKEECRCSGSNFRFQITDQLVKELICMYSKVPELGDDILDKLRKKDLVFAQLTVNTLVYR